MRDTLIGITTMTLLFGLVWLSQNKANTNKEISYNNSKPNVKEVYNSAENQISITEEEYTQNLNIETPDPCESCNSELAVNDNFTFSEAFKLCRECLGDEGTFTWRGYSYSTKVKEVITEVQDNNLVEKEDIESSPPEDSKEIVSSN